MLDLVIKGGVVVDGSGLVIVGGREVVRGNRLTGVEAGRVLRFGRDTYTPLADGKPDTALIAKFRILKRQVASNSTTGKEKHHERIVGAGPRVLLGGARP